MTYDQKVWMRCLVGALAAGHPTDIAGEVADRALGEFRKRWPRVRLPEYVEPVPGAPGTFRKMIVTPEGYPQRFEPWVPEPEAARAGKP